MRNLWGGTHRRPTWRKAGLNESFCVRDVGVRQISRKWAELQIPKLGYVRFRLSRSLPATHGMARVTLDRSGRWHASFTAPQPTFERVATGAAVGIDLGLAASVTTSEGRHLKMPPHLSEGEAQRKRRLQRQMARQQKGSNRRARTKHALAVLSARESDRRKDWLEQTTTRLVRDHDRIVLEDLKIKNMVRSAKGTLESPGTNVAAKRSLNRSIQSQGWATFRRRLTDKAEAATIHVELIVINPAFTSQRCSGCGHTAKENRKSQAVFVCGACGYTDNADVNAAKNILAGGHSVTGRGGTPPAPPDSVEQAQRPNEASTTRELVLV